MNVSVSDVHIGGNEHIGGNVTNEILLSWSVFFVPRSCPEMSYFVFLWHSLLSTITKETLSRLTELNQCALMTLFRNALERFAI